MMKLLLFDLDETLLTSAKTISPRTLAALDACRARGLLLGVSTSRGEHNVRLCMGDFHPDILVASGGAVVIMGDERIHEAAIPVVETRFVIDAARRICGDDCGFSVDTADAHYGNFEVDPRYVYMNWGESIYSDFRDFTLPALKISVEIPDPEKAAALRSLLPHLDFEHFSGGCWYKFTRQGATKEHSIEVVCAALDISPGEIVAFGDDNSDIGMLRSCGIGVAMGNAIEAVKAAADIVIGGNDEDGIAAYLENCILR
ncbi:MAG: HAD family hydrolase [Bacillota bacterium]|nr:HAD family hydrolase [Bacillota bacterium]